MALCLSLCLCVSVSWGWWNGPFCQQTERDWLGKLRNPETQACSSMSHDHTARINCLIYWNRPCIGSERQSSRLRAAVTVTSPFTNGETWVWIVLHEKKYLFQNRAGWTQTYLFKLFTLSLVFTRMRAGNGCSLIVQLLFFCTSPVSAVQRQYLGVWMWVKQLHSSGFYQQLYLCLHHNATFYQIFY